MWDIRAIDVMQWFKSTQDIRNKNEPIFVKIPVNTDKLIHEKN